MADNIEFVVVDDDDRQCLCILFQNIIQTNGKAEVGGGWRTGCGSHPPSAERVEELEESVWSVVR